MPRPKRTKVAPSRPAPRVQQSPKAVAKALPQEPKDRSDGQDDISDSDDKVTSANKGKGKGKGKELAVARRVSRGRARANEGHDAGNSDEALPMMTGALGISSEETQLADMDLESSSPSVEVGRRDTSTTMVENSTLAIGNFKRRPRPQSILGRRAARARSSSIESNLAENDGLTTVRKQRTTSTSNNAPGHMGGRVRSSSIGLDMDRNASAVPGSALRIGNFKRRARAPSVLGTGQKPRAPRPEYDLEDEDDFSPDDQSTPLNLSKSKATVGSSEGSSNSRKRKLSAVQVPRSQESPEPEEPASPTLTSHREVADGDDTIPSTEPLEEIEQEEELEEEDDNEDEPEDRSRSPSQELPPLSDARHITPEPLSSTMAPPESSTPAPDSPPPPRSIARPRPQQAPARSGRPVRAETPLPRNQDSPPSSPPSLTHSPNGPAARTAPRPKKQPPPVSTLSTAELQALLPRRRRHTTRDPFDIPSEDELDVSGLASDEDELSTMRPVSRRSMAPPVRKPTKLKPAAKSKRATYGRAASRAASDKENDAEADPNDSLGPLPDDAAEEDGEASVESSQALEKRVGKELKNAARKFQEVDKWELDFEECTASSSSQTDAR